MLDLFGEFGGVLEVLIIILEVIISPWASFSFQLKALQKLYWVRTEKHKHLFNETTNEEYVRRKQIMQELADKMGSQESRQVRNMMPAEIRLFD